MSFAWLKTVCPIIVAHRILSQLIVVFELALPASIMNRGNAQVRQTTQVLGPGIAACGRM